MTALLSFCATQFRNLSPSELEFSPALNLITGQNGSGKSSLLEAIYHLSAGHSFRTKLLSDIISHGHDYFVVRGLFDNAEVRAIQKSKKGQIKAKRNATQLNSLASFAKDLPILLFYQTIFQVLDAGPSERRRVLDWGVFHVEHDYFNVWKQYKKVLVQRNALLKSRTTLKESDNWTQQLIKYGMQLDAMRVNYLTSLTPLFKSCLSMLSELEIDLEYQNGWKACQSESDIAKLYENTFEKDNQYGFTQYGPHKADILIKWNQLKVKSVMSRGEQKLILIALKIAQSQLLRTPCIYLFDDLAAEVDDEHLGKILSLIIAQKNQVFITNLNTDNQILNGIVDRMFHVKHGVCV